MLLVTHDPPCDEEHTMGPFMQVNHARGVVREAPDASGARPGDVVAPHELAPISGISLERYAQLSKALGARGLEGAAVAAFLAGQGHTRLEWQTAADGWNARMKTNAALLTHFATLYEQSPQV
jgi:hypothetical protein